MPNETVICVFDSADKNSSVVNISSVQAHRAHPGFHAGWTYQASKGAITTMTKCMALDLSADGIRVNSISPGYIWTEVVSLHFLLFFGNNYFSLLAPVVQKLDSAIHRINHYPVDK